MTPTEPIRIAKIMAERGLCSRREAEQLIAKGWVFADGERIREPGARIHPSTVITLDDQAAQFLQEKVTILLHKPLGVVSGQPEKNYTPAVALITPGNHYAKDCSGIKFTQKMLCNLAPAGRLDIDSQGLLVLTQDGVIAKTLIGNATKIDKEYLVRVDGTVTKDRLRLLNHGLSLDGKELKPAKVSLLDENQLKFILWEGRKRQIRRMCDLVGLKVTQLKRVRIGNIHLGDLPYGKWRFLGPDESF